MTTLTVVVAGEPVQTTVTARPAIVRRWVYTTRWRLRRRRYTTVGLGVQWMPVFRGGADERPATLQICAGNRCLVFQIAQAGGRVPMILRRFLADRLVTFAGYNVDLDCRKLRAHHGLIVSATVELHRASGMGHASLEEMAERHLGIDGVSKPREVATSEWDGPALSKKQVRYVCVDAYLSYSLGVRLRSRNDDTSSSSSSEDDDGGSDGEGSSEEDYGSTDDDQASSEDDCGSTDDQASSEEDYGSSDYDDVSSEDY